MGKTPLDSNGGEKKNSDRLRTLECDRKSSEMKGGGKYRPKAKVKAVIIEGWTMKREEDGKTQTTRQNQSTPQITRAMKERART